MAGDGNDYVGIALKPGYFASNQDFLVTDLVGKIGWKFGEVFFRDGNSKEATAITTFRNHVSVVRVFARANKNFFASIIGDIWCGHADGPNFSGILENFGIWHNFVGSSASNLGFGVSGIGDDADSSKE